MSENKTKTGTDKQVRKMKTRCYYTNYVNHAIRFYLSTPDKLLTEGKRKSDILNWISVQTVFHALKPEDKQVLTDIYKAHYRLSEGVRIYCDNNNVKDEQKIWVLLTKVSAAIARIRGLI